MTNKVFSVLNATYIPYMLLSAELPRVAILSQHLCRMFGMGPCARDTLAYSLSSQQNKITVAKGQRNERHSMVIGIQII